MLEANCPRCGPTLVGAGRIRAMSRSSLGIEVEVACPCGERIHLLTGRAPEQRRESGKIRHLDPTRP